MALFLTQFLFAKNCNHTKEYVDQKHESVMDILQSIEHSVQKIDDRTYELAKENK